VFASFLSTAQAAINIWLQAFALSWLYWPIIIALMAYSAFVLFHNHKRYDARLALLFIPPILQFGSCLFAAYALSPAVPTDLRLEDWPRNVLIALEVLQVCSIVSIFLLSKGIRGIVLGPLLFECLWGVCSTELCRSLFVVLAPTGVPIYR